MNEWMDLHGESLSDFDPEPELEPNGEWICPRCGDKHRTHLKPGVYNYQFCVKDNTRKIWRGDNVADDAVYCWNCEAWIEPKDFVRWTGDDMLHYLCSGCDADMREPVSLE
jgi:hypothetical protein